MDNNVPIVQTNQAGNYGHYWTTKTKYKDHYGNMKQKCTGMLGSSHIGLYIFEFVKNYLAFSK